MSTQSPTPLLSTLDEVDQHFCELVAGVQDYAIFLLDVEGRVRTWNAGAERIKGYKPHEIIGQSFTKFYPPEAVASGFPLYELGRAAEDGRFEDEGWRLRKDGTRFWVNVIISALYDRDKKVRGFLKITRDLTERKLTEQTLRQSEERFRLLVEGVRDYGIFMLDPEGRISSWNAGAERIKGYKIDEVLGKHFSIFYSSEDVASGKPARELEEAIKFGSVEDEGWRVRKDRSLFWASVVITALYDEEKNLRGFAKVTRDMTDRRSMQELQFADRQKNDFLAMLAHELRNPLAPISTGLQLLKIAHADDSRLNQTTELMSRQLTHLIRLVDDLLDISRIINGKIGLHKQPVELSTIITRAVEEVQSMVDARGHELMIALPAKSIIVDGDVVRLAQVFSNILANAAKYSANPAQIWLAAERTDEKVIIRIKDNGMGIAADFMPKIFDLFVQADNSLERKQGGLGIGLTLVKRIIELHGGQVHASSGGLGKGSEFVIELPLSAEIAATKSSAKRSEQQTPSGPRRKILVIDDNVDAATTVAKLLTVWGHDVQVAFDGNAALAMVRSFRPEIMLLDIGLPGMSGYEVAKQIRSDASFEKMKIAALTGYGQSEDRERSFAVGCDFHVTKPLDPDILAALVSSPDTFAG